MSTGTFSFRQGAPEEASIMAVIGSQAGLRRARMRGWEGQRSRRSGAFYPSIRMAECTNSLRFITEVFMLARIEMVHGYWGPTLFRMGYVVSSPITLGWATAALLSELMLLMGRTSGKRIFIFEKLFGHRLQCEKNTPSPLIRLRSHHFPIYI